MPQNLIKNLDLKLPNTLNLLIVVLTNVAQFFLFFITSEDMLFLKFLLYSIWNNKILNFLYTHLLSIFLFKQCPQ
jgi:hypothetical protein